MDRVAASSPPTPSAFSHAFDLTKRLNIPSPSPLNFIQPPLSKPQSPFDAILHNLSQRLAQSPPSQLHRLVIPALLSPALYPACASQPRFFLQFLHSIRALLRKYPTQLTALITLPLELFPRFTPLVRWAEMLSDGVLELTPFPHLQEAAAPSAGSTSAQEEQPQGMFKIHRLPIFHERGGGVSGAASVGDDLAFTLSRRRFVIKPFSLPPVEGDTEAQRSDAEPRPGSGKGTAKIDLEF